MGGRLMLAALAIGLWGQYPPPRQEPKPATPQRIRLGCAVSSTYIGPSPQWSRNTKDSLSEAQVAELEAKVAENAEDLCARGYLIAYGGDGAKRRANDLLWMMEHHPEWDGFLFYPRVYGQSPPTLQSDIRSAWLRQIGPSQGNAIVLHHAAKFFDSEEPFLAEELLLRAIRMEPGEPFHQEGLAVLYAREANMPMRHPSFAEHAKAQLLLSNDPMVWAAALNGLWSYPPGSRDPWRSILQTRLGESREELIRKLPSRSEKYRKARCPVIPLLKKCVEKP